MMIQAIQQKPNEDPSEFLERIYRKHIDADPQTPENVWICDFYWTKYPRYQKEAPKFRRDAGNESLPAGGPSL